jgi:hypothetical protein
MPKDGGEQLLPDNNGGDAPAAEQFAELLPVLYYGVNRVLDICAPAHSRKVVVVLWALASASAEDKTGKYLTTQDIARTFRDWFVVSEANVSSEVSKVKKDLFDLNYIKIEGGHDHIHLSRDGEEAMHRTLTKARTLLQEVLGVLNPGEQLLLAVLTRRMLEGVRRAQIPAAEGEEQLKRPINW